MRVTPDKNGDPFGFCDANCAAQLRIGGNRQRVEAFRRMYPWAAAPGPVDPVMVTDTVTPANPVQEPEPEPPKAKPKRAPFGLDQLLGGA